jgi:predicted membrane metal-binding protein
MLESVMSLSFWVSFFSSAALIAIPIVLVGRAKPWRSFLAALVIYVGVVIVSACNISVPF